MAKLFKALKTNEVFQQIEEKNNVALLKSLTNPNTEDKAVFLTTLKRWYAELTPEESAQYADKIVDVKLPENTAETAGTQADKAPAEKPKRERKAKDTATDAEPKPPTEPKEKATDHISEMVMSATEGAEGTYTIEDKFLLFNGTKVLRVLKDGVSIRESVAKANEIEYERKGYNHPFKAKVTAETVEAIKELLPKISVEPVANTETPENGGATTEGTTAE